MQKFLLLLCLAVLMTASAAPAPKSTGDAELFTPTEDNVKRCINIMPPGVKTIACIAPGSHPGSKFHKKGIELLRRAGYKVKVMPNAFVRQKKEPRAPLAGRLSDFYQAWNDPEVDMIFCVRGGRGSEEVMDNIDWKKLKHRPGLYFQGYSDITMILCALLAKGNGHPIAGPMAGAFSGLAPEALEVMKKIHHGQKFGPLKLTPVVPGDCKGLPIAGLLQRFAVVSGKEYCPDRKGKIIFIESVGANPAQIKAQFDTLLKKNFFKGAAGVVFCQFVRCKAPKKEVDALLKETAPKLGVPVYMGFPFGHTSNSYCIDFTRPVEIKNSAITFPAVK
jgi:muramoyltetrapeptide carboxypeptidase